MKFFRCHLLVALTASLMFAACATLAPPQPPSLELPKPPLDLRAVRKGNRVVLTWTVPTLTTDRQAARSLGPTRICRGSAPLLTQCGTPVGEAPAQPAAPAGKKSTATYTDAIPAELQQNDPAGFLTYAIEVTNAGGRGAGLTNLVRVPVARTLPPPLEFAAHVTSQGVVLTWAGDIPSQVSQPPQPPVRYVYRIYRRAQDNQHEILAGEVPADGKHSPTLTDANIEWEKTYEYRAETVTVLAREGAPEVQIEGDDTPAVKVFADDVFPPAVPSGVQAVYSGVGGQSFIDLIWAPVPDIDLAGYNVYRHEAGTPAVKLNTELVKTPAFRDLNVSARKNYLYSVSAVDARGNESARSEEAGESVP
jgi:hypothetical protein